MIGIKEIIILFAVVATGTAALDNSGDLARILANEPLDANEALEILKHVAQSDQRQLNAKALVELSQISADKCQPVGNVFEKYLDLDKSLGPYLRDTHWRQVEICAKTFGERLVRAAGQLDEQVRADVDLLASGLNLGADHDVHRGFPENNLISAIVNFVVAETKKPGGERRYFQASTFGDMKDILIEGCKKVNEVLGPVMDTPFKVDFNRLSAEQVALFTNGKLCEQVGSRSVSTFMFASQKFKAFTRS